MRRAILSQYSLIFLATDNYQMPYSVGAIALFLEGNCPALRQLKSALNPSSAHAPQPWTRPDSEIVIQRSSQLSDCYTCLGTPPQILLLQLPGAYASCAHGP